MLYFWVEFRKDCKEYIEPGASKVRYLVGGKTPEDAVANACTNLCVDIQDHHSWRYFQLEEVTIRGGKIIQSVTDDESTRRARINVLEEVQHRALAIYPGRPSVVTAANLDSVIAYITTELKKLRSKACEE